MSKNTHHKKLLLRALPLLERTNLSRADYVEEQVNLINDIKDSLNMARKHTITHQGKTASMLIDEDLELTKNHELEKVIQRTKCVDKSCMSCETKSYE